MSIATGIESAITDVDQAWHAGDRTTRRLAFHVFRLLVWIAQLPLVVVVPGLMGSVAYLTALSIGAGIEGAITDVDQARCDARDARESAS